MMKENAIHRLLLVRHRKDCTELLAESLDMAIAALRKTSCEHNGWIFCNEKLPKVGQDVLFSVGDLYVAEGCYRADGNWTQFRWSSIVPPERVTAWMPLPEPYESRA